MRQLTAPRGIFAKHLQALQVHEARGLGLPLCLSKKHSMDGRKSESSIRGSQLSAFNPSQKRRGCESRNSRREIAHCKWRASQCFVVWEFLERRQPCLFNATTTDNGQPTFPSHLAEYVFFV